jgi:putative ABC transport system permease protein
MKNEFKLPFYLAFQSLRRGRKWTLFLTILLMAVAFINLIFVSALFNGIVVGSNQQIIDTLTGNVYMAPKQGIDYINDKGELLENVRNLDGVTAATSSFQVLGRIERNSRSGRWPILAINPKEYAEVINVSEHMYQGEYLDENDEDKIILGRQIAGGEGVEMNSTSLKGVSVGDKVNVVFDGSEKTFTVKGIFYTKFIESDSRAFVTERSLKTIAPPMVGKATTLNIKSPNKKEEDVLKNVSSLSPDTDAYLWREAAGLMKSVSSSFTSINVLMTTVGVIIAAVTTFIVIYVDIINRRRQIGILRAIGIKPYIIVFNYVILAAVYVTFGILLGSLIFRFVLVPYFVAHPFELPITDAVLNLTWIDYIARVQIVSWVAVISGFIPAIIVTRAKILDAILGK